MKVGLRHGDRRALLGLALAGAVYLTSVRYVLPTYDKFREESATVGQKEEELRKFRRALASQPHYKELLDQVQKSVTDAEGRLIRGDNPTLASVELQTIVEAAATKVNLTLGPRTMSPAKKKDNNFNEITLSLSFEGTLNQVTAFLSELRSASKQVTVRTLQIAPMQAATERPEKGELRKTVRASLTISALLAIPPVAGKS